MMRNTVQGRPLTLAERKQLAARMSPGAHTTIVRKRTTRSAKPAKPSANGDLDTFRARAHALRLRGKS